jgi:hypothetical protein
MTTGAFQTFYERINIEHWAFNIARLTFAALNIGHTASMIP